MQDKFRIDSHKLMYHPKRIADWFEGKNIYPLYVEISPAGGCNHRCEFCSVDFMGYKPVFLEKEHLLETLREMGTLGVKSVMFAGEGEPLLHKDIGEITEYTKKESGIDVAFTTNGVLMKPQLAEKIIPFSEWIKVSCNAGTAETYGKIHGTSPDDFTKLFKNLEYAVKFREKEKLNCTLGIQTILLPVNIPDVRKLADISRNTGLDYIVVKPYMPHYLNQHSYDIKYEEIEKLEEELEKIASENFKIIYRAKAMEKWDQKTKPYDKCFAMPFWAYIDSEGNVWGCSARMPEEDFNFGNIYKNSFKEIWEGEKRMKVLPSICSDIDPEKCKITCRMDEINRYLWNLKNPPEHVNFI